jgi:hypothetical protein
MLYKIFKKMNSIKLLHKNIKKLIFLGIISLFLSACNGKLPGGDARKYPPDPKKRVAKNLEEGRGITLNEVFGDNQGGGVLSLRVLMNYGELH